MRILHIKNVANLAWRLAQAQRRLGHDAIVWSRGDRYGFPYDVLMPSGLVWNLWMLRRLPEIVTTFDVLHIHGGAWPGEAAYKVVSLLGVPIFMQFNGSEARNGNGLHWTSVADGTFYTDPDIAGLVPSGSRWLPQPIDVPEYPTPFCDNERPLFVHVPSSRQTKGTDRVIDMFGAAFGPLRQAEGIAVRGRKTIYTGRDAELWVLDGIPHEYVESVVKRADVLFDQISPLGIYGYASIEAMALGRPVLSTVDRGLYPPDCPVVYPRAGKLMELARDAKYREWLGQRGHAYAARVHESTRVAQRALDAYAKV